MKKTLYYAEIYFKGHFIPWNVYRTGFKPDIPRMESEHLFPKLEDLEDAILRAKDECADGTIDEIRKESVEVYTCRDCGMEFGHDEMRESGECDPCYRAAAMGPNIPEGDLLEYFTGNPDPRKTEEYKKLKGKKS